jgi:hypothetical protein
MNCVPGIENALSIHVVFALRTLVICEECRRLGNC